METLVARIKRLRDKVGLTQEGLAKRVDVSKNTVLNWEKDRREPRSSEVEALADALCVPVSELLPTSEASILVQPTTRPVCPTSDGKVHVRNIARKIRRVKLPEQGEIPFEGGET